jgi:hypothetical protein
VSTFWFIAGMIGWGLITIGLLFLPFVAVFNIHDGDWLPSFNTFWTKTGIMVVGVALFAGSAAGFSITLVDHLGPGIPPDGCYRIQRVLVPSVVSTGKVTVVSENAVPEFYSIPCPGGS